MKALQLASVLAFGILANPQVSHAQIRDNEASQSVLAVQCAVSSGFSASDYEDYCRRLAKTLSLLSSEQQTRVFGYLPMPAAASLGMENLGGNFNSGGQENPAEAAKSPLNQVGSTDNDAPQPPQAPDPNSLVGLVGKFNSLFDGTASTATSPVLGGGEIGASSGGTTSATAGIASSTPSTNPDATTISAATDAGSGISDAGGTTSPGTTGTTSTTSPKPSNNWSALIAWFQAAEAAYKAGTLSSFLKGGN